MGLFGGQTTTQTNSPWSGAVPYINQGMQQAQSLYNSGQGFNADYQPMSGYTQAGNDTNWGLALNGNELAQPSSMTVGGLMAGGAQDARYNDQYAQNAGAYGSATDKYNQLYAQSGNPYFEQALNNQVNMGVDDVNRQFSSMGRYGSGADTNALMDRAGQIRTDALSSNWNQNIANQRGILGDQAGMNANYGGMQAGLLGQQGQSQLAAVGAAPGAYDQRFLPGRAMQAVGASYEDVDARRRQAALDQQNAGWNRLSAYNAGINGNTNGTGTQTVKQPDNTLGGILGGLLGGASLLSGL